MNIIISPDIDGSCDVYSSLNFAYPLAENGLLKSVSILYRSFVLFSW